MISPFICGPLCQHPGCWKAKTAPPTREEAIDLFPSPRERCEHDIPSLSVSLLEPQKIHRHRSLPPIKASEGLPHSLSIHKQPSDHKYLPQKESTVPRVSHIIVQAGFQCHAQKRWIWLPSLQSQQPSPLKGFMRSQPPLKDLTDELIQSRPASSNIVHTRNSRTRLVNSRPKGSSYLDLIKKMGHLNLLDLPHYLQVKLLENNQFRKVLSTHPIDNIPANVLSEGVLLELMRCQLSPQLPANPSLEGVGIFFDPPDDLTSKQEPKTLIMPKRPTEWPIPKTYVPSTRRIEPSDLPGPMVKPVGKPSFREYIMNKRSSTANSVIEMPQMIEGRSVKSVVEERSTSHITSVTTILKDSIASATNLSSVHPEEEPHGEEEEEEDDDDDDAETIAQSLDIVLPADEPVLRIPSAVEDTEEIELAGISNSLPPTRDSWRHTSFSTVTPFSEQPVANSADREPTQMMTPPQELKSGNPSATDLLVDCEQEMQRMEPDPIPPPTCTPAGSPNRGPTPVELNISSLETHAEERKENKKPVPESGETDGNSTSLPADGAGEPASVDTEEQISEDVKKPAPLPELET